MGDRRGQRRLHVAVAALFASVLIAIPATASVPPPLPNPILQGGCPLDVALIVDASTSTRLQRADIQDAMRSLVDGLEGTGSTLRIINGSTFGSVAVAPTPVTAETIASDFDPFIDGYYGLYGSNWEAWFARVPELGSPDVVVFLVGYDPMLSGTSRSTYGRGGATALEAGVREANAVKLGGSRIFGVTFGGANVSAVSGPLAYPSSDYAEADHVAATPADLSTTLAGYAETLCSIGGGAGDLVWWDVDGDGRQGPDEPGIPGVTVTASAPGGAPVAVDVTDDQGAYSLRGLPPGDYVIDVAADDVLPGGPLAGFSPSPADVGDEAGDSDGVPGGVIVTVGDSVRDDIDFGFSYPTDVSLVVAVDHLGDDVVALDPVQFGATVENVGSAPATRVAVVATYEALRLVDSLPAADDPADDGELNWSDLGSLSAAGSLGIDFDFVAAEPATAAVTVVATAYVDPDGVGPLPEIEVTTATGSGLVEVAPPPDALIGDRVWWDLDEDGVQDDGEPGLGGVTLELLVGGVVTDVTTTDGLGGYAFDRLEPGEYVVRIAAEEFGAGGSLEGFDAAPQDVGDDALDSDGDPTGHDVAVTLVLDQHENSIDFGFVLQAGGGGLVVDASLPGVQRFLGYYLPWEAGDSHNVIQGNSGPYSHQDEVNRYAWDFSMAIGTPVLAAAPGIVRFAFDAWDPFSPVAGNYVLIQHADRVCTLYLHVGTVTVQRGQVVGQGEQIATAGDTGTSGSAHLHYAVDNCAWISMPSSFVEAGVPTAGMSLRSANPADTPTPAIVNPVEVGQVVALEVDADYVGGAAVTRAELVVTFDEEALNYVASSENPSSGGPGVLRWNDHLALGETFTVGFVTDAASAGAVATAEVTVFTDPDGAGPLPEVELASALDMVTWQITAPPEPVHLVGTLYGDVDGDGDRDVSELGLAGITVEAWLDDGDSVFEPGEDDYLSTSAITDQYGQYDLEVPPDLPFWVVPADDDLDGAIATAGAFALAGDDSLWFGFAWPEVQLVVVPEDRPDGATLVLPGPYPVSVTFNYTITNTGETALRDLVVVDDAGTPGDASDDLAVCSITGPIAIGAEQSCSLTRSLDDPGTSTATVTATPTGWAPGATGPEVSDSDSASVQRLADGTNPDLRSDACGSDIVLVLDESGSVSRYRTTVTQAARNFLAGVSDTGTRVAIVEFSSVATLMVPYTEVTSGALGTIETSFVPYLDNGYYPTGFTNWKAALEIVRDDLSSPSTVIFFTDGNPNILDGVWVSERSAAEGAAGVADHLKAQGVHMFAVGAGRSHDIEFLEEISGPDRYPPAPFDEADYASSIRMDLIDEMFADYAARICAP